MQRPDRCGHGRTRIAMAVHVAILLGAGALATDVRAAATITCPVPAASTTTVTDDRMPDSVVCNVEGELVIDGGGGILTNVGDLNNTAGATGIFNTGVFDNQGVLTNENYLNNSNGAGDGGTFTNSGTVYNNYPASTDPGGHIINETNGSITNTGSLYNEHVVDNHGGDLTNTATGQIDNGTTNYAVIYNDNGSTLSNAGTLNNNSYGSLYNSGTDARLDNTATGTINNSGYLYNEYDARLYNDGTINNATDGVVDNYDSAVLTNRGVVNNSGVLANNGGAQLYNDGTINNASDGIIANYNNAVLTNRSVVDNSGVLYNDDASAIYNDTGGNWSNTGGSALYNYTGATFYNGGTFNHAAGASLTGSLPYGYGDFVQTGGSSTIDGDLTQQVVDFQDGTLGGSGSLAATGAGGVHIGAGVVVNPGNSTGTLTFGSDTVFNGTLEVEIVDLLDFDLLDVLGTASFGTGSAISFLFDAGYAPMVGDEFEFLTSTALAGLSNVSYSVSGLACCFGIQVFVDAEEDLRLRIVPEPASLALAVTGLALLGRRRRATPRA